MKYIPYILCIGIGAALYAFFMQPKIVENIVVKTETRIDTIFTARVDTVYLTETVLEERIDTVYYSEPYKATVSVYSGSEVLDYGSIDWRAETTGKLTNLRIIPNLQFPTVIKEIETVKTVTTVKGLRGIYAGAGINQNLGFKFGASYVDKSLMFNYEFQPVKGLEFKDGIHWIGVKKRLF